MNVPNDGLLQVVKRDCPTCRLITPVVRTLSERGLLAELMSQDDPGFPDEMAVTDDRDLAASFELGVDIVPTLIKREGGKETGRVIDWHRGEWQNLTGVNNLGVDLPDERPGCGSLSVSPGMEEELRSRYGETGLQSRTIPVAYPIDEAEQMFERGWTDGLPVVPPTAPRVLRMLQGTNRSAGEIIGEAPPSLAPCSVEKAAVNAVMAGCKPEYFPVVLTALEAALDPGFQLVRAAVDHDGGRPGGSGQWTDCQTYRYELGFQRIGSWQPRECDHCESVAACCSQCRRFQTGWGGPLYPWSPG